MTWTHRKRPGRTLAIVDAENLLGPARFDPYGVACCLAVSLAVVAELEDDDHIVVGSDVTIGHAIGLAFPGRRLVVGRGRDGADDALLAAVGSASFVSDRFDRVVLASGDHICAPHVRVGVEVWVVARPAALSRALACEASFHRVGPAQSLKAQREILERAPGNIAARSSACACLVQLGRADEGLDLLAVALLRPDHKGGNTGRKALREAGYPELSRLADQISIEMANRHASQPTPQVLRLATNILVGVNRRAEAELSMMGLATATSASLVFNGRCRYDKKRMSGAPAADDTAVKAARVLGAVGVAGAAAGVTRAALDRQLVWDALRRAAPTRTVGMGAKELAGLVKTHPYVTKGASWEALDTMLFNNRNVLSDLRIQLCEPFTFRGIDGYLVKAGKAVGTVQDKAGSPDYIRRELAKRPPGDTSIFRVPKGTGYTGPGAECVVEGTASRKELARALRNAEKPGPATLLRGVGKASVYGALIGSAVELGVGGYHVAVKHDREWDEVAPDLLWNGAIGGAASGAAVALTTAGVGLVTAAAWPAFVVGIPVSMGAMWLVRKARREVEKAGDVVVVS